MESDRDIPPAQKSFWLRVAGIIIGFLGLIWLPFEDTSTFFSVGLAVLICTWLAGRVVLQSKPRLIRHILIGSVAGAAVVPVALALMAVKGGLHTHGFADFVPLQVRRVIAGFPYWVLGGLLFGLIVGLCRTRFSQTNFEEKKTE
jgi:hypothetical protein